ncbi:MAG: glycosyltransferase [Paludibacteraceae bacterium]|nr:glycosyltransferase [Paludibacteraceae bacterium]
MISVVIPLYNKSASIARTIQSILDQTFQQFEIVVVDDGSTDGSVAVLESIEDKRLRLIKKENGGVCSARNKGIQEAKYDYIALLDADDCFDKEYLAEQIKLIKDFPEAMMWGINFAELYDGKLIRELPTGLPKGFRGIVEGYFDKTLQNGRISDLFCSSSVVIRKSVFDVVGAFDERIKYAEDTDMWWRIIANFPVVFYDKYMVFYYYDAENRAMNRERLLKYWLPYYVDKYSSYKGNEPFYTFAERWCAVKIKQVYFNNKNQRTDAKTASAKLDYRVLPIKYKYLFQKPYYIGKFVYIMTEFILKIKKLIG